MTRFDAVGSTAVYQVSSGGTCAGAVYAVPGSSIRSILIKVDAILASQALLRL